MAAAPRGRLPRRRSASRSAVSSPKDPGQSSCAKPSTCGGGTSESRISTVASDADLFGHPNLTRLTASPLAVRARLKVLGTGLSQRAATAARAVHHKREGTLMGPMAAETQAKVSREIVLVGGGSPPATLFVVGSRTSSPLAILGGDCPLPVQSMGGACPPTVGFSKLSVCDGVPLDVLLEVLLDAVLDVLRETARRLINESGGAALMG